MKSLGLLLCLFIGACTRTPEPQQLAHGRFSAVTLYTAPVSELPPLLLLADTTTETATIDAVAAQARSLNAALFVINSAQLRQDFADDVTNCRHLAGDFDNLARYLEAYLQLPGFIPPVLLTTNDSATIANAVLTPLPSPVFSALAQLGNDGDPMTPQPCGQSAAPAHISLNQGFADQLAAYYHGIQQQLPSIPMLDSKVAALPLTELPAAGDNDMFAILLSGDGGWAGFDKELADALQAEGVGVVGWDSLRYFWQPRSPSMLAADLDTVIAYYSEHWHKARVVLLGFSQGANVLPFTLDLLHTESRAALAKIALISPEQYAQFEFHLGNWIHTTEDGLALAPVLDYYKASTPLYCLYGAADATSVCPSLHGAGVQVKSYDSGHHLNGAIHDIVALLKS